MATINFREILIDDFLNSLSKLVVETMQIEMTVDWEAGKRSDLYKSIRYEIVDDNSEITMNDYWKYVGAEIQRRPMTRKIPLGKLINWIQRYGIRSRKGNVTNKQLAFTIQNSIFRNGIMGKNFNTRMLNAVREIVESIAVEDDLFNRYYRVMQLIAERN